MKLIMLSFLFWTGALLAQEKEITLPLKKEIAGLELLLNGTGIRKATVFKIKVYEAGLYLSKKSKIEDEVISGPLPKHIELHFLREVEAQKLRETWPNSFKDNNTNYSEVQDRVLTLNNAMKDLKKGDVLSFTFLANHTTQCSINKVLAITIPGEDFQKALLRVWLGPQPPNEDLKSGLLSL